MSIPDSSYKEIADEVYNVEPSKAESNDEFVVEKGGYIYDKIRHKAYQVLLTPDNNASASPTPNGMQAMAVVKSV